MTDEPGREPEQRLPARRPPSEAAPVERFSAPPAAHRFELTPARAAGIVRQSASARWVGLLASIVVVLFVVIYWFYELGAPLNLSTARLDQQAEFQQVTAIERGYTLYQANCARCHGEQGEGGIGPILNDDAKLYLHLSPAYLHTVMEVGGRYVCGNAKSLMPIWSNTGNPPGPLNYIQIEELIEFMRSDANRQYNVRNPELNEPIIDPLTGEPEKFQGWYDEAWRPAPDATPVPACYLGDGGSNGGSPGPSIDPSAPTVTIVATTAEDFDTPEVTAPADTPFTLVFDNQDALAPHNVVVNDPGGTAVDIGANPFFTGPETRSYNYPALAAGAYPFICQVHPVTMVGTLTVK